MALVQAHEPRTMDEGPRTKFRRARRPRARCARPRPGASFPDRRSRGPGEPFAGAHRAGLADLMSGGPGGRSYHPLNFPSADTLNPSPDALELLFQSGVAAVQVVD